jgi:hypothetical protein
VTGASSHPTAKKTITDNKTTTDNKRFINRSLPSPT